MMMATVLAVAADAVQKTVAIVRATRLISERERRLEARGADVVAAAAEQMVLALHGQPGGGVHAQTERVDLVVLRREVGVTVAHVNEIEPVVGPETPAP